MIKYLRQLYRNRYGIPVWTRDSDGEVRRSRMKNVGGKLVVWRLISWVAVNEDGTVPTGYMKEWWKV